MHIFYAYLNEKKKKNSYVLFTLTYVTLFGKTGLNEICVEKHFNAF